MQAKMRLISLRDMEDGVAHARSTADKHTLDMAAAEHERLIIPLREKFTALDRTSATTRAGLEDTTRTLREHASLRVSCSVRVRVVSLSPARVVEEVRSRAVNFSRRGIISRSCSAAAMSSVCLSAVERAWATPSSMSRRETNLILACMSGSMLSQTDARCRRWGGGPLVAAWKARGSGAAGRNPRVRPVPEPELPRISVEGTGEVSRGGREAEGGGEAFFCRVLEGEVVGEDMLREARKGAKGEKSQRGHMGPAVKGGWSAI